MKTTIFEIVGNELHTPEGKVFLSKKEYAKKYKVSMQSLGYMKFMKRIDVLDVLGAKFFEDKPPVKMRYKNLDK